jgi:phage-related holin
MRESMTPMEWIVQRGAGVALSAVSSPAGWLAGFVASLWGALAPGTADGQFLALLVLFMLLDTGGAVAAARRKGEPVTWQRARRLVSKTFGYMLVIGVAAWVTMPLLVPQEVKTVLVSMSLGLLIGVEGLSILRHASALGIPVPGRLIRFLETQIKALSEEQ